MTGKLPLSKITAAWVIISCALAGLVLSIIFASDGIIRNDAERNIFIPEELLIKLRVKAAYNNEDIFWRFEWAADQPSFYHDYLIYQDGKWVRHGSSPVGEQKEGLYEDRLSFFVDDGSVEYFAENGCYITVSDEMRFMTDGASKEEVQHHLGKKDVRKFLPETRSDPLDWRTLRPNEELEALVDNGYFLDLWHWRAHRSNPLGYADDQHVSWYRLGDEGKSPYTTNWNEESQAPNYMFNPELTGQRALRQEKLLNREYGQDDLYYLSEELAVPFDPAYSWQEGDTIPYRLLREPDKSRGSIRANGRWESGLWRVDLIRPLDTGNPRNDKVLKHLGTYDIGFAVHKNATGSRWHYVSLPYKLGLGRPEEIEALRFTGDQPPWAEIPWAELTLFYPGQVTWNHVFSPAHGGYECIQNKVPVRLSHTPETLTLYGVESEFREEIQLRWVMTMAAWTLLFLSASWGIMRVALGEYHGSQGGQR